MTWRTQYDKFVDLVLDCANLWAGDGGDRSFKSQPPTVSVLLELLGVVLHKVSALPPCPAVLGGTDLGSIREDRTTDPTPPWSSVQHTHRNGGFANTQLIETTGR